MMVAGPAAGKRRWAATGGDGRRWAALGGAGQSGQPGPLRQVLARSFGNRFAALAVGLGVTRLLCRLHSALPLKLTYGTS